MGTQGAASQDRGGRLRRLRGPPGVQANSPRRHFFAPPREQTPHSKEIYTLTFKVDGARKWRQGEHPPPGARTVSAGFSGAPSAEPGGAALSSLERRASNHSRVTGGSPATLRCTHAGGRERGGGGYGTLLRWKLGQKRGGMRVEGDAPAKHSAGGRRRGSPRALSPPLKKNSAGENEP